MLAPGYKVIVSKKKIVYYAYTSKDIGDGRRKCMQNGPMGDFTHDPN